tara:strand:+ start:709 stop:3108 length:2400 start_codon:yes stop_codon:yes gene_type:complete
MATGYEDLIPVSGYEDLIPKAPGFMTQLGRGAASLADVTLGSLIPGAVQFGAYPLARMGRSPEDAQAAAKRIAAPFEQPFGRAFGVTETPQYQQESSRQLMDFIGQNFQKGAKFISEKTGLPQADVENMIGSATVAAPKVVQAAQPYVAPVMEQAAIGARLPFADRLQARAEAASLKDYARGPQIDAAANAQRLGIAIDPTNIEPSASSRLYSGMAGPRGPEALSAANKNQVRNVALNEMDLPPTTQLDGPAAFDTARANVSKPYDQVKELPIQQANDAMIQRLEGMRADLDIIGAKDFAPAINKIVDDAIAKTQTGLTGESLLKNIRVLRERARKTYNNKSSSIESLDIADTNLKVATELESMIENSITNPKLLGEFRDARQKMARTYAYEGATDFNTGMVDVGKLARITAKDSNLTGDIAALGKIAGNFPEAFTTQATSKFYELPRATRSGLGGGAGALLGSNFGLTGSILGGVGGGLLGEFGGKMAASRMANPNYQAGLTLSDMRIPVNQMATLMQPIPQSRAVVPYQAPVEVLQPGEGTYFPNFVMRPGGPGPLTTPGVAPGPAQIGMAQGPVGGQMGALRMEDVRARDLSMSQGAQAELQQAAAAAAARQPTGMGAVLDFDPITGTYKVGGAGVKGATPEIFMENLGKSLMTATEKVAAGKLFDLTAAEKVAFDKTKVDLATVAPELKKLANKDIASKIMDREWVQDAITKAQQKAQGYDELAVRGATDKIRREAAIERDKMQAGLDELEEKLRQSRPVSGTGQGPKTRAFRASQMVPPEITNAMDILSGLPRR